MEPNYLLQKISTHYTFFFILIDNPRGYSIDRIDLLHKLNTTKITKGKPVQLFNKDNNEGLIQKVQSMNFE